MKRAIIIISILTIIIVLGFIEIYFVKDILNKIDEKITNLIPEFEENKNDITIFSNNIKEIDDSWDSVEGTLCILFNHRDLNVITDSLNKLLSYTDNNDYDNAIVEIHLLKEYSEMSFHIMGFNIYNIL